MRKVLKIIVLLGLAGLVVVLEVGWLGQVDYENQKARAAELFLEIGGEMNMIEAGLLGGGEVDEAKVRFEAGLGELRSIPYVARERGEVLGELMQYGEGLPEQIEFAKELKVLESLCAGFADKIRVEYKDKKIDAELFRTINRDILEFGGNLPEVQYEPVRNLVVQLDGVIKQIGVSAAAVAVCVGICPEANIKTQAAALEKKLEEAMVKIGEINREIRGKFYGTDLVNRLY